MKINQYFKSQYLTCGKTYDNFIFENCGKEFLKCALESLSQDNNGVKSVVIKISRMTEAKLEKLFDECLYDLQRKFFAKDFVNSLFMMEILKDLPEESHRLAVIKKGKEALVKGNYYGAVKYNQVSPNFYEIQSILKKVGKIELNIFLNGTKNVYLQQAINDFVSSRLPYSVKVFASQKLVSYFDQQGNFLQAPHDYLTFNLNHFIENDDQPENE